MGSLGTGEILIIVLVALIVFGPHRLPEITRKAGEWLGKAREMTRSVTDTLDAEYGDITKPIKDLKGEYDATMGDVKGIASSVTDMSFDLSDSEGRVGGGSNDAPDDAGSRDGDSESPSGEEPS
ncbi:MAG: twin-arginine translocase TatA/TatE family subunit [Actinomycetota bacterium]|nr:twin-arginine translocase TatA/TatE family subunit [Actinomycetota bacterium]